VNSFSGKDMDLSSVVRQAYELFEPAAEDKNISFHCDVRDEIHLAGDTPMIQRMLSNLLDNAIKYTPSGGSVSVAVSEKQLQADQNGRNPRLCSRGIDRDEFPRFSGRGEQATDVRAIHAEGERKEIISSF
jgi:signal transduction histidine kinase